MAAGKHINTVDQAKQALFGPENGEVSSEVARLSDVVRGAVFKGMLSRDVRLGVELDRRLPFSQSLGRACFVDLDDQSRIAQRSMVSTDVNAEHLTVFGGSLREAVSGTTFVDLGCGGDMSFQPKEIAHVFGAHQYIGIDKSDGFVDRVEENGKSVYMTGDILETLVKLTARPSNEDLVLFLCGIELSRERPLFPGDPTNSNNDRYAEECRTRMDRIRPRAIVIGPGTSRDFRPNAQFFRLAASQDVRTDLGEIAVAEYELWVPKDI